MSYDSPQIKTCGECSHYYMALKSCPFVIGKRQYDDPCVVFDDTGRQRFVVRDVDIRDGICGERGADGW